MDFELNEDQQQVKSSVREFAEGEIAPHVREWDEKQHFPSELVPKMAAQGFMGVIFPEEYGGAGMGYVEYVDHHRGAFARGRLGRHLRGRAQFALLEPHLHVRHGGAEAQVSSRRSRRAKSSARGA